MQKIIFYSSQKYDKESFERAYNARFKPGDYRLEFETGPLNAKTTSFAEGADAVCVFVNDTVDEEVIAKLSYLGVKAILLRCAGFNNVDLAAAKLVNIPVLRVPGYSPQAVAEHAFALLQTLNRKTHRAYNRVRDGNFNLNGLMGHTLYGKTAGVIGTGRIGQCVARIFVGLGMKVIGADPFQNDGFKELGTYVDQQQLLREADVISLHSPLLDSTYHMINEAAIASMKPGVMLINTSRGALIDTQAVIEGLRSKKIGALGMDVYEKESDLFFKDLSDEIIEDEVFLQLTTFPNVLITGHQAFFTEEALDEIANTTFDNAEAFFGGNELKNAVK